MVAWSCLTKIIDLCGFLGLKGYHWKFVWHYGIIARPLMNLLKKGKFGWHNEAKAAFRALKKAMTTNFILAMPNFNDPFTIVTNAFRDSIGTILI